MALILASESQIRRQLLEHAGLTIECKPARVDESAVKKVMFEEGAKPLHMAEVLAELKSVRVSTKYPGSLVLGADQVLECGGKVFGKPRTMSDARARLIDLSSAWHSLPTMAVISLDGKPIWRAGATPRLKMRDLSPGFIDNYLSKAGEDVLSSVGAYQVEGLGVQLFEAIEGDYFSILGLPLLPVLNFLRVRGAMPQ